MNGLCDDSHIIGRTWSFKNKKTLANKRTKTFIQASYNKDAKIRTRGSHSDELYSYPYEKKKKKNKKKKHLS